MKLLKLVYFAHGWYLGFFGDPLINESVQAWKFGPVVPSLYHAFKEFRTDPIRGRAQEHKLAGEEIITTTPSIPEDANLKNFLNRIWEVYGRLTGLQLSTITHQPGSPWHKTWFDLGGSQIKGAPIPNELIKDFFAPKIKASEAVS